MINRRQFLRLGAVSLASASLPSFAKNTDPQSQASWRHIAASIKRLSKKNSSLSVLYPRGSYGNIKVVISAFKQRFGITINAKKASLDDIASQMMLDTRLGKHQFDIALPPTFSIPTLAAENIIQDITDYAQQYEPAHYFDSSLYQLGDRFLGRLYGYQADGDAYMMFYNQRFLDDPNNKKRYEDKYQTSLRKPMSWTELDQQIRFFNNPNKNQYGGSLFRNKNYMVWEFWVRLHARGLFPVSADMTPLINHDIAVEELEKMISLNTSLAPDVHKNGLFENFDSFAQGNKYCNLGWGGTQKYMVTKQAQNKLDKDKLNLSFSPTLSYGLNKASPYLSFFNWGWNYVVSKQSQQSELAYLFCLFVSSPEISTLSVRQADGYFDPYRQEHYDDEAIIDLYGQDFLQAHKTSLKNSIPDFYIQGKSQYMHALRQGIYSASQGRVPAKKALNLVANKWQSITDKLGKNSQASQWESLQTAYPTDFKKSTLNLKKTNEKK